MTNDQQNAFLVDLPTENSHDTIEYMSTEQLQHLIHLIDHSDVSELEVKHATKKTRLILRKAQLSKNDTAQTEFFSFVEDVEKKPSEQEYYTIKAQLVGIFQCWSRSVDKPLVAVGDIIKEGQHVGVVRSLDIPNEVEAPVTGRVTEILVQDGQLVEYGQPLMTVVKH